MTCLSLLSYSDFGITRTVYFHAALITPGDPGFRPSRPVGDAERDAMYQHSPSNNGTPFTYEIVLMIVLQSLEDRRISYDLQYTAVVLHARGLTEFYSSQVAQPRTPRIVELFVANHDVEAVSMHP